MRKQIAAANWKMNLTFQNAEVLLKELSDTDQIIGSGQVVLLAVPFPYLLLAKDKLKGKKNIFVAAQNCSENKNGAYTGEISAEMLQSMDIKYVILGHSERRQYNAENNQILAEKINRVFEAGLHPVFCCGEPLEIRESGKQNNYVETQLKESLFHLEEEQVKDMIIAYEPIWAIGTGKTASSAEAQEMHAHIRSVIAAKYGNETAATISILYGGSVKGANALEIFSQPDVDGGLVGGASLVATEFNTIIKGLKKG